MKASNTNVNSSNEILDFEFIVEDTTAKSAAAPDDLIGFLGGRDEALKVVNAAKTAIKGTKAQKNTWYAWDDEIVKALQLGKVKGSRPTLATFQILSVENVTETDDYGTQFTVTMANIQAVNYSCTVPMRVVYNKPQSFPLARLASATADLAAYRKAIAEKHGAHTVAVLDAAVSGIERVMEESTVDVE